MIGVCTCQGSRNLFFLKKKIILLETNVSIENIVKDWFRGLLRELAPFARSNSS